MHGLCAASSLPHLLMSRRGTLNCDGGRPVRLRLRLPVGVPSRRPAESCQRWFFPGALEITASIRSGQWLHVPHAARPGSGSVRLSYLWAPILQSVRHRHRGVARCFSIPTAGPTPWRRRKRRLRAELMAISGRRPGNMHQQDGGTTAPMPLQLHVWRRRACRYVGSRSARCRQLRSCLVGCQEVGSTFGRSKSPMRRPSGDRPQPWDLTSQRRTRYGGVPLRGRADAGC